MTKPLPSSRRGRWDRVEPGSPGLLIQAGPLGPVATTSADTARDWSPVLLFQQGRSRQTIVPASFESAVPLWVAGQNSDTEIIMQTRANRYSIRRPLEFAVRNGTASTTGQGRTVNISRGGVLFQSDGELSVGGRIELVVRLAEGAEADTFVTLFVQGVTVRSDDGGTAVAIKKHRLRVMPSDESKLR